MTDHPTPPAEMQKLLKELERLKAEYDKEEYETPGYSNYQFITAAARSFPRLLAYIRTLEKEHRAMREVLSTAWTDIRQWQQLARYQREKMDQNLGWCPTDAGIEASEAVCAQITKALSSLTLKP